MFQQPFDCAVRQLVSDESPKYILKRVRDHSGTHATAPVSQNPAHRPHHADHRRPCETLIGVSQAERQRRDDDASRYTPGQRHELPLQVAAVNSLLADTSRY